MHPEYINQQSIDKFIKSALEEDIGEGDHTTNAVIDSGVISSAELFIKEKGVMAGMELAEMIFKRLDSEVEFKPLKKDGAEIDKGDVGFVVKGNARAILSAERVVLNCMQRMSAIATKTKHLTDILKGTKVKILDTRKTAPNFRIAEKWAVLIGGGENHRFGLYDMIMLKDNHIDLAGGIPKAIQMAREYNSKMDLNLKIEIETRTMEEVKEVLNAGGVDIVMLDNMKPALMEEACKLIKDRFKTEASGGITETNILKIAGSGIDYVSVGAITHSYSSLDMSLKALKP